MRKKCVADNRKIPVRKGLVSEELMCENPACGLSVSEEPWHEKGPVCFIDSV
jgi:hypothetical protein